MMKMYKSFLYKIIIILYKMVHDVFKCFDKVIPVGGNCYFKLYFTLMKYNQETYFFDYLGSPMWAVNQLIDNGFKNLFIREDYVNMNILSNKPDEYIYTNKKYYLVIKHDFKNQKFKKGEIILTNEQFNEFQTKYERRIERFNELMNTNKNILFLRFQEHKNKVIYPEYEELYKKSELEYMFEFSDLIKTKFSTLKFKIIYITKDFDNKYYEDKNLIVLKDYINIDNWVKASFQIKQLFIENKDFLLDCINN